MIKNKIKHTLASNSWCELYLFILYQSLGELGAYRLSLFFFFYSPAVISFILQMIVKVNAAAWRP